MRARDWAVTFNETFAAPASAVQARIWAQVYGADYPAGLDTYSHVTWTELGRFVAGLQVGAGDTLVDVGCGRGGPGLWIAASTGAGLIGLDISSAAVDAASGRAGALALDGLADFRVGTFEDTGLPDSSVQAVMSIDALLFTPDKAAAMQEFARVLVLGGRLVFTTWDYSRQPEGRPPQVADHRPLLEDAGFDVRAYEETRGWREQLSHIDDLLLRSVGELAAETDSDPSEVRSDLLEMHATLDCMIRRVFVAAVRR